MSIYNDVKISICICGDMVGDLPQYVLLSMEWIGYTYLLYLLCMYVAGVLSVRLRLVAAQRRSARGRKAVFIGRAWEYWRTLWLSTTTNSTGTVLFRECPGLQAQTSVLRCFDEQVVMAHRQCGSGLPF